MTVNDTEYTVLRLLGKGKGGYSYLVTDGEREYVLKQIHHEPCEYYIFGDKLQSELRDYETLRALGIPLPRLLAVDKAQERLLKEYIAGPTVLDRAAVRVELNRSPAGRPAGKNFFQNPIDNPGMCCYINSNDNHY